MSTIRHPLSRGLSSSAVLASLVLAPLMLGCTSTKKSQMIVGIATDMTAPQPLRTARLRVYRLDGKGGQAEADIPVVDKTFDISGDPARPFELPGSYALSADDEPELKLVASGLDGAGHEMVNRTAILKLIANDVRFLRLALVNSCVSNLDCPDMETCIEGVCQTAVVSYASLPVYTSEVEKVVTCSSGTRFVDTSTKSALAIKGGGTCGDDEFCVEGTCIKSGMEMGLEPETFIGQWEHAYCAFAVRCGLSTDESSCVARELQFESTLGYAAAVRQGRVTLDAAKALDCLNLYKTSQCGRSELDQVALARSCHAAFVGTVANGAECVLDDECQSGSCSQELGCESGNAGCCHGRCRPRSAAGGPCDWLLDCQAGLGCSGGTCYAPSSSGACHVDADCPHGSICGAVDVGADVKNMCVAPATTGATCGGDDCDDLSEVCDLTRGQCRARLAPGATDCKVNTFGDLCADNAHCVPQPAPATGTVCVALAKPNETCQQDSDCLIGNCLPPGASSPLSAGLVCRVSTRECSVSSGDSRSQQDAGNAPDGGAGGSSDASTQ